MFHQQWTEEFMLLNQTESNLSNRLLTHSINSYSHRQQWRRITPDSLKQLSFKEVIINTIHVAIHQLNQGFIWLEIKWLTIKCTQNFWWETNEWFHKFSHKNTSIKCMWQSKTQDHVLNHEHTTRHFESMLHNNVEMQTKWANPAFNLSKPSVKH